MKMCNRRCFILWQSYLVYVNIISTNILPKVWSWQTGWCWKSVLDNILSLPFVYLPACQSLPPPQNPPRPPHPPRCQDNLVGEGVSGHCLIWDFGMLTPKLRHIWGCSAFSEFIFVKNLTQRLSNHFLKIQWKIHFFYFFFYILTETLEKKI